MEKLTQEDYKNILALIARANITGQEAMAVAILQNKLNKFINAKETGAKTKEGSQKEASK